MIEDYQCTYFPALEMVDPSPVIKVSAISIKKEPDEETEDISIKEEPFLYGNEVNWANMLLDIL